jgi:integrase/recombinase XerD
MSERTVEAYVAAVASLANHYHRSPDRITDEELQAYLLHLRQERHLAPSSLNQNVSALRRFYDLVLHRPTEALERLLPRVRSQTRRPQVFSRAELERLFTIGCPQPKARAFLMTVYGAGLRLNEACHLKPEHIDSARMQIRVELGKGGKDRYTLLPPRLLEELRAYYRAFRPQHWLFPSRQNPERPLPDHSGQHLFWTAVKRAGLPRKGGIHSLRHSFATHLLEAGVEITVVQRLLGHSSLSSTTTYLHVREERLAQIQGPLQQLHLPPLPVIESAAA